MWVGGERGDEGKATWDETVAVIGKEEVGRVKTCGGRRDGEWNRKREKSIKVARGRKVRVDG